MLKVRLGLVLFFALALIVAGPLGCGDDETSASGAGASSSDGGSSADGGSSSDGGNGGDGGAASQPCAEDEHVQSNACVSCPQDTTNDAGDDPSGPDTLCDDACTEVLGVYCSDFEQAYIKASNAGVGDLFGHSVALDGDTLAVGAYWENSNATGVDGDQSNNDAAPSGAVYVFVRSGTTWSQQAYIKASNTEAEDYFGISVALDGDTLAVGAFWEDSNATGVDGDQSNNDADESGAVYVFVRSGTTWTQQAYIKPSNTDAGDLFGREVALDGDTLAVGADVEDSNATGVDGDQSNNYEDAVGSGAVYVFVRSGTTWSQQAYIKASNTGAEHYFGSAVALDGDTLAVGADYESSNATGVDGDQSNNDALGSGAVYVRIIAP